MAVLAGVLLAGIASARDARFWNFRVELDDAVVGHHRYTLRTDGSESELVSEARFSLRLLGIEVYRYEHDATERWRGACLESLRARTDNNGRDLVVQAVRNGAAMTVTRPDGTATLAGCVKSFAYWQPAILRESQLLNAQSGEYEPVQITMVGTDNIVSRGATIAATRYRISARRGAIDLWYSPRNDWLQLETTVSGGRRLRYVLV